MIKWIKSKKSKTVILVLYVVVIEKILQFGKLSFFSVSKKVFEKYTMLISIGSISLNGWLFGGTWWGVKLCVVWKISIFLSCKYHFSFRLSTFLEHISWSNYTSEDLFFVNLRPSDFDGSWGPSYKIRNKLQNYGFKKCAESAPGPANQG